MYIVVAGVSEGGVDAAPVSGVGWKEKRGRVVVAVLCGFLSQALVYLLLPSPAYLSLTRMSTHVCVLSTL
jgi:hypothetical protein